MQTLRSSVEGFSKINAFQGMIDQSIVTNKMLINMNENIGNLASEIRNAFKSNSIKELNNEITETKKKTDPIVVLLDELQRELKACGNVDIAKSVEKFEQRLKASKSTAEELMNTLNKKIGNKYNAETQEYFDKQLFIGEQNEVFSLLNELQKELRACGDIDTAKSIKEFEQHLRETVSTSGQQIDKIKDKISTLFSAEDAEKFAKSLEPKQAEITVDTVIKQLQELKREYASVGDTNSSNAISEYLQQLKIDTIDFEGQLQSLKTNLGICLGTEEVARLEEAFRKANEPISETEQLTAKLKDVEQQLRACGETAKANKIKEYMQETQKKTTDVDSSINELRADIEKCFGTKAVQQFNQKLKETDTKLKKTSKGYNFGSSLRTALGIGTVALGIRKTVSFLNSANTEAVDYAETVNLFNVAMGKTTDEYGNLDEEASKYYTKAIAFQEKLSEKLGINIKESMEYQGLFNAMSKSMGISADKAYLLSENFTKLGYDLASLYNINTENAMQKLRAGLSGQTKPLRDLGLDITQQSLEPLLDELGIERSVKQLSQAEKMVARYIVVLRQASIAHGDFAKTMDSPANQLRIFNAQVTAFKRNIGSLWQNMLGGILPYVNAIMMVINELLKMVAKLFGFEVWEQDVSISTDIGVDDLADDLGTATGKAKELKNQLMGFDEINNISLPDNSSSGSGGASVGGIDQRLLDAMKEYDNLMDKVKNKATEIRDKMMEWLGFTGDTEKDLKKVKGWLDKIKIVAKIILALYIGSKLLKLIGYLKNLKDVFLGIKTPITSFQNGLALVGKGLSGTWAWLKLGVEQFKIYRKAGDSVTTALGKTSKEMFNLIPNTIKVAGGIAGLVGSCALAYKSMEDLSKDAINAQEAIGKLMLSIGGGTASGALIGSIFGLKGAIIGGLVGALATGVSALFGYKTEAEQAMEKTKDFNKSIQDSYETMLENNKKAQEYGNSINTEVDKVERLKSKLSELVDESGKVKKGYEDRAKFILGQLNNALGTEFTLNDLIKGKYEEIIKTIDKVIEKKKQETILTMFEEKYTQAMKDRAGALQKVEETTNNLNNALSQIKGNKYEEDILKLYDSWNNLSEAEKQAHGNFANYSQSIKDDAWWWQIDFGKETGSIIDNLSAQDEAYRQNNAVVKQYSQDIVNYNQALTLSEEGKTNELSLLYDEQVYNVSEAGEAITTSHKNTIRGIGEGIKEYKIILESGTETQKKAAEEEIKIEEDKLREIAKSLKGQATAIEEMTPEIVEDWKQMAISSKEVYSEQISTMPPDTKMFLQLINGEINASSPDVINSFSKMSIESKEDFNKGLELLPEDTRGIILASTMAVTGLTETTRTAYSNLSEEGKRAFNNAMDSLDDDASGKVLASIMAAEGLTESSKTAYGNLSETGKKAFNEAMSNMDIDARQKVQDAINEINGKSWEMYNAGYNDGKSARDGANDGQNSNGGSWQIGNWFVRGLLNALTGGQGSVWWAGYNLVKQALFGGNEAQKTGSPAKETIKMGNFFTEGYIIGLKKQQDKVKEVSSNLVGTALKELNKFDGTGFTINPKDFAIDTNQFIDYGQISGAIQAQSNINISSNIAQQVYEAVIAGMKNVKVQSEIDVRADEGIIVKKASKGFNDYVMQTGELPFIVPAT